MLSRQPDILLVPGGGHGQSSKRFLRDHLQKLGYIVHAPTLPCFNCEPPTKTLLDDIDTIKATIEGRVSEGKDVVVVAHSAGAITASAAVCGMEKKQEDKAGVKGLVFMSGMLLPKAGVSVREVFGSPPFEQVDGDRVRVESDFLRKVFYSDIPNDLIEEEIPIGKHMPQAFWSTKTPAVPWTEDRSTIPIFYISFTEDALFPPTKQKAMYSTIPGVQVREVKAGHMGVISQPEATAKVVDEIVKAL